MGVEDVIGYGRQCTHGMSVPDVARHLDEFNAILVDLRDSAEIHRTGRIPQAIHFPIGLAGPCPDLERVWHIGEFDATVRTILYCADGTRSAEIAATLLELGHTGIGHLLGGITAWENEGRPITHLDLENL